jgi:hypothetical protein
VVAALIVMSLGAQVAEAARMALTIEVYGAGKAKVLSDGFTCKSENLDHRVVGAVCDTGYRYEDAVRPGGYVVATPAEPVTNWKFSKWQGGCEGPRGLPDTWCEVFGWEFNDVRKHITVRFEDYHKPVVTRLEGTAGTVHNGSASFSFSADEAGQFLCRLVNEMSFQDCTSGAKEYSGLSRGQHTFEVKAIDPSGNVSIPQSRSWTVDFDSDGDGYDRAGPGARLPLDCDDANDRINPGATDILDNGPDENCDGKDGINLDRDGDGHERSEPGGKPPFDCNDTQAGIHPGAVDVPDNGIDEDCDGEDKIDFDRDRDGYDGSESGGEPPFDCNDTQAGIHPGAVDVPDNGIDEDCDGRDALILDRDGDGYDWEGAPGGKAPYDCDDANVAFNPGAFDVPKNGVDENCDKVDADWPSITSEVRYVAKTKGRRAIIRRLSVIRPPDGAKVELRCRGKGCTFARRRQIAPPGASKISFTSALRRAKLRRGALLEIWVTRSGMRGKVVRLRVGRRGKVSGVTLCVLPGSKTPTGCPPA